MLQNSHKSSHCK